MKRKRSEMGTYRERRVTAIAVSTRCERNALTEYNANVRSMMGQPLAFNAWSVALSPDQIGGGHLFPPRHVPVTVRWGKASYHSF